MNNATVMNRIENRINTNFIFEIKVLSDSNI